MRTNLKKALAVLLTMAMLCTLLPLSALSVSAADAALDVNFNDGSKGGFDAGSAVQEGPDGSYCLKWTAGGGYSSTYRSVSGVYRDKTYVINFKAKSSTSGVTMGITIQDGSWGNYYYNEFFKPTTSWAEYTIETNVSDYPTTGGSILFKFQDQGTAMDLWIDDLTITEKGAEPDPEPEVPSTSNNLVINGNFEDGNNGWSMNSTASIVSGGHSGSAIQLNNPSAWSEAARQDISVEADTTYTLTWYAKRVSGTGVFNMEIAKVPFDSTKPTVTAIENQTWMNETSGNWVKYQVSVKTTDANGNGITKIMIKLTTEATNPGILLIDDITLTKDIAPSFDGYIYNGDFETGSKNPWVVYNNTAINTTSKYEGNYGLYLGGDGGWDGLAYQTISGLKVGKEYTVSMKMKALSGGVNVQILNSSTSGDKLSYTYIDTGKAASWTDVTLTFTAVSTTIVLNFCGDGTGTAAKIYVDNVKMERVGGEVFPEELHKFGGTSIKENADGIGLAFKFDIKASNGKKNFDNTYVSNSAQITLDETQYSVIKMGAVMTNDPAIGGSSAKMILENVNGKKTIDVEGKYLAGITSDSISFAVRILDIPEKHQGTTIYARPYYVYKEDGQEVVVYGSIKSETYAKVANPKSSIKILSIGHSFSKDVMETYLWDMFKAGGYEEIVIGYLYIAGCPMPKHLYNIQNGRADYEYGKNENGTWVKKYNSTALYALQDEEWDYVNIQSSPDYIGGQTISKFKLGVNSELEEVTLDKPMTEYECITPITDWIQANATNSSVKTDYNMIWSFSQGCDLWSGEAYHKNPTTGKYDQMVMYNNIIEQTKQKVLTHDAVNNIIPCGTAIQNARTSFIGDNFNEPDVTQGGKDGYHLNSKYGDYTAALTWYCHYSRDNANVIAGYKGQLTDAEFDAIAEAVNNAINTWDEVTESTKK